VRRRFAANAVAAGSMLLLAGCAVPATPAEPRQPSPLPAASPIPPVKNPRDVAAMAQRPCELLTPQQARQFGLNLPPQQLDYTRSMVRCEWSNTFSGRTLDISAMTNNLTLEAIYSRRSSFPTFEATEISGYPAILRRTNADLPLCFIDIKPAERESVSVVYESKEFATNPQQACVVGKQVAEAVIANLPPKR
jgi:hypothetical protein